MTELLKLTFLGAPRVSLHDRPLNKSITGKHLALLIYLATTDQVHTRDAVADLLWSEMSNPQALKNLRDVVADLRKVVDDYLEITRQTLAFNRASPHWLDVAFFRSSLLAGIAKNEPQLLQTALDVYQQEFLAGFSVRNAPVFEEWITLQRSQLHSLAVKGFNLLGHHYIVQQEYDAGLIVNQRWLTFDPESEAAHRQRMHLLAANGQRSAALTQYDLCRQLLAEEFGVAPAAETVALYEQIKAGSLEKRQAQPVNRATTTPAAPGGHTQALFNENDLPRAATFCGRQAEVTQLQAWLIEQQCSLIGIFGMGGQGKTALAAHLVRTLANAAPFDHILWCSLLNAPPPADLFQEWLHRLAPDTMTHLPASVDEQLALLLRHLKQQRCLLVLDNLESILVPGAAMGAFRPGYETYGQLVEWMGTRTHRSALLLTSRERPAGFQRLQQDRAKVQALYLTGLPVETGRELWQTFQLGGSDELVATLIDYYSGNPLALKLVATTVRDFFAGDLAAFLGGKAVLFADIRQVLDQHFARLSPLEQSILFWLAIHREPIVFADLLADLVPPPARHEVLTALAALQRSSLVDTHNDGFGLQNVVMEYVTERLIETICEELTAGRVHLFDRHALLQAQRKEYIRESQQRILLRPVAEQLLTNCGAAGAAAALQHLLLRLQSAPGAPGYAAANVLHLLLYWQMDLRGYDFAGLAIWQADLRRVRLPQVNFAGADLKGTIFTEPLETARSLCFSPDGQWLAIGAGDGQICLWHLADRQPDLTLQGHTGPVYALAFSADGARLASASGDRTVRLWDLTQGRLQTILPGNLDEVLTVIFDPTGEHLLSVGQDGAVWRWAIAPTTAPTGGFHFYATSSGTAHYTVGVAVNWQEGLIVTGGVDAIVRCWDVATGQLHCAFAGHTGSINALAIRPDGKMLASGSKDQTVKFWVIDAGSDRARPPQLQAVLPRAAELLRFSPDGRFLLGATGSIVWLWDTMTNQLLHQMTGHSTWIAALAYSPDGRLVASGGFDQTVRVGEVASGRAEYTLVGLSRWLDHVRFSPDGATFACSQFDHSVHLWTSSGQHRHVLRGHHSNVRALAFSPDSQILATGGDDATVCLWSVESGQLLHTLHGHTDTITIVTFSPDGATLISGSHSADEQLPTAVFVWDVATGQARTTLSQPLSRVWSAAFHADGVRLAIGSTDGLIYLYNIRIHQLFLMLQGHTAGVRALAFQPAGALLASGSDDGTIRLWDLDQGQLRQTLIGHTHTVSNVIFSKDGQWLVSASDDQTIRIWAWAEAVGEWQLHGTLLEKLFKFNCIALSPDGATLVSGNLESDVHLWDLRTGQLRQTLCGHTNLVTAVDISPDGQQVISSSSDGTVRVWAVETGACLATLQPQGPYAGLNITGVTGINPLQRAALKALGAVEYQQ